MKASLEQEFQLKTPDEISDELQIALGTGEPRFCICVCGEGTECHSSFRVCIRTEAELASRHVDNSAQAVHTMIRTGVNLESS